MADSFHIEIPQLNALLGWMGRKGIAVDEQFVGRSDVGDITGSKRAGGGYHPVEYLIARSIGRHGIPAKPFLFKAFNELKPKIRQEFEQVPKRIIARLSGGG
jgi:hypothetical protein